MGREAVNRQDACLTRRDKPWRCEVIRAVGREAFTMERLTEATESDGEIEILQGKAPDFHWDQDGPSSMMACETTRGIQMRCCLLRSRAHPSLPHWSRWFVRAVEMIWMPICVSIYDAAREYTWSKSVRWMRW